MARRGSPPHCDVHGGLGVRALLASDYFHNLDFVLDDFVLFDALDGADMAKGTGALLAMNTPSFMLDEAPDADKTVTVDATVNSNRTEDIDGDCYSDDGDTVGYGLFFLCSAIWVFCLWGIIPFIGKLTYKLPFVKGLVDDLREDLRNIPWLLFQLAYVCAGTYLLEEAVLGVFFFDPLARIGWLMERGRVNGTYLAQEFAVIYLWAWWKAVVPAERARAQLDMGFKYSSEGVPVVALAEWVVRGADDGSHRKALDSGHTMTQYVLDLLDGSEGAHAHRPVYTDEGLGDHSPALLTHEAGIRLDDLG
ncbi:hypothetical protein FOMPIDRAFT_1015260 [Fomitopsis schrenkii]|uniref:Uncharacterized protein n=1 Tax=Fomitopsis schrenkii TaxID=2126942 RepID=S8FW19_FOMSC|nr:hypothetical protein FOMPIDRAFT_1015260 [Fomitopsis schrenkii]